jgi:glutathione S-transferase
LSQLVIQLARHQFGINPASAKLAPVAPECCFRFLHRRWEDGTYWVGDSFSVADIAAVALVSPLALIPQYRIEHPSLFERIAQISHTSWGNPASGMRKSSDQAIVPAYKFQLNN